MIFSPMIGDRKIRAFTLSPSFIEQYRGKQPKWGFGELGLFTFKRTYARPLCDCVDPTVCGHPTEEWVDTCKRVVEGVYYLQKIHCRQRFLPWDDRKAQASAQEMFRRMWDFKFVPPGRGLWMMGTNVVLERGGAALNNCGFISTEAIDIDFAEPFCFLMDMSMLGVGVGGDTRGKGKVPLCAPRMTDNPFVVEDSREGWVELIRTLLNSFVNKAYFPRIIDFRLVRKRGMPLKTFGGTSSGPKPLLNLVENLTNLLLPEGATVTFGPWDADEPNGPVMVVNIFKNDAEPTAITSAQIVDIFNYIGKAVVAGGIRRTAEIMFGDADDNVFLSLKQDKEALADRRWASNNSVWGRVGMDYEEVSKAIAKNGEPGIVWMDNARAYGRMGRRPDHKDKRAMGCNPCVEQTLENAELCCLVETFPAHHETFEDYQRTLKMAYLYAKSVTLVPTHNLRTNGALMKNRRIGCSMSGIQQAKRRFGRREFLHWCDQGYAYIQDLDELYSGWLAVPRSLKTTSVKPSGTVSLLAGATPGIHYPHSEHYIRNVRVKNTSPLVRAALNAGYPVEPAVAEDDTSVISFPVKETDFSKGKRDASIWEQFADAAAMQRHWADNQVSCTVTFTKGEAQYVARCLEVFEDQLKAISLLPLDDHGYAQAPYIEITAEQYAEMVSRVRPLDFAGVSHEVTDAYCDGDKCEVSFGK